MGVSGGSRPGGHGWGARPDQVRKAEVRDESPSPRGVPAEPRWRGLGKDAGLRMMDFEVLPAVTLWLLEIPAGNGETVKYKSAG